MVEDEVLLRRQLAKALADGGYAVDCAADGEEADLLANTEQYDAVVLDLGLPRMSGLEVLRRLRSRNVPIPVLILTAMDTVDDRIKGLDAGADDYLAKPFDMGELAARLRALIRRASGKTSPELNIAGVKLEPAAHRVIYRDQAIELPAKEFAVLHALMLNAGRVLSRTQIEEQLYAWGEEVESNAVEVYIHHLRRKLYPELIETIRGVGYWIPEGKKA